MRPRHDGVLRGLITLQAPIKVRRTMTFDGVEETGLVDTTMGQIIFNNPIPQDLAMSIVPTRLRSSTMR